MKHSGFMLIAAGMLANIVCREHTIVDRDGEEVCRATTSVRSCTMSGRPTTEPIAACMKQKAYLILLVAPLNGYLAISSAPYQAPKTASNTFTASEPCQRNA